MLSRNLADQLEAALGISEEHFGDLYRSKGDRGTTEGSVYFWPIAGMTHALNSNQMLKPESFAEIIGAPRTPGAGEWKPLIESIMHRAKVLA